MVKELYTFSAVNQIGCARRFKQKELTILIASEATTSGMPVGVAVKAPTRRHHSCVSCLRGKHGGELPTAR